MHALAVSILRHLLTSGRCAGVTTREDGLSTRFVRRRSGVDVLVDQLRGVEIWTREHSPGQVDGDVAVTRELRLDMARRRDGVERQRQALIDWTARQLRQSTDPLYCVAPPRAVLVHRNDWFKGKVGGGLRSAGIAVVAELDNGADAVGVVVAEQPDLLLTEDKLPTVSGPELVREVCRYAPSTVVVVQVADELEIGSFLAAGASTVYTRRTPPADIVAALLTAVAG